MSPEIRTVTRRERPDLGSNREVLPNPLSTTIDMPSMVKLVSAMDVANTTFLFPFGWGMMAACCLVGDSCPYKGWRDTDGRVCFNILSHCLISPCPSGMLVPPPFAHQHLVCSEWQQDLACPYFPPPVLTAILKAAAYPLSRTSQ